MSTHENPGRQEEVIGGSNRAFGLVFCVVFLIIALWPLIDSAEPRWWALAISGVFLFSALFFAAALAPLNRVWTGIGLLMHKVVNPVVLGLMFFVVITPSGLIMRALGKDPLRLKFEPDAPTYWIRRTPPGPGPESLKQQF